MAQNKKGVEKFVLDTLSEDQKDFFLLSLEKKVRNLNKKLKEIKQLEQDKRDKKELNEAQLSKIASKDEHNSKIKEQDVIARLYLEAKAEYVQNKPKDTVVTAPVHETVSKLVTLFFAGKYAHLTNPTSALNDLFLHVFQNNSPNRIAHATEQLIAYLNGTTLSAAVDFIVSQEDFIHHQGVHHAHHTHPAHHVHHEETQAPVAEAPSVHVPEHVHVPVVEEEVHAVVHETHENVAVHVDHHVEEVHPTHHEEVVHVEETHETNQQQPEHEQHQHVEQPETVQSEQVATEEVQGEKKRRYQKRTGSGNRQPRKAKESNGVEGHENVHHETTTMTTDVTGTVTATEGQENVHPTGTEGGEHKRGPRGPRNNANRAPRQHNEEGQHQHVVANDGWNVVKKASNNHEGGYQGKPRTFNKDNRENREKRENRDGANRNGANRNAANHHITEHDAQKVSDHKRTHNPDGRRPQNKERAGEHQYVRKDQVNV